MQAIILLNKPQGITSNSACNKVKRILKADKAGHLGTLDPMATGLLPVTLGKATRLFDYFLDKDKEYISTFKFGILTDTLDISGKILKTCDKHIALDVVQKILKQFLGKQNQIPPAYSAKKINGKKAYELARNGEEVNLKPKSIEIYDIEILSNPEPNVFTFKFSVSSGTYIRSIARDMGEALSTYGTMLDIIRTRCGIFDLKDAHTFEDIERGNYTLLSAENLNLKSIIVKEDQSKKLKNGINIKLNYNDGDYKLYSSEFLGIITLKDSEIIRFIKLWE